MKGYVWKGIDSNALLLRQGENRHSTVWAGPESWNCQANDPECTPNQHPLTIPHPTKRRKQHPCRSPAGVLQRTYSNLLTGLAIALLDQGRKRVEVGGCKFTNAGV